jgi:DNA-binding CsgD family transcriptional regulator
MDERIELTWTLMVLGCIARDEGDVASAYSLLAESLALAQSRESAGLHNVVEALDGFAGLAVIREQHDRAARLAGAAAELEKHATFRPMAKLPTRREQWLDLARAALGAERVEAAFAAGRRLTQAQAVAEALAVQAGAAAPVGSVLTRRELEVAALVARGFSNREIAEALVIAVTTAERHVANILAKLDLSSRTQIATWVVENNISTSSG